MAKLRSLQGTKLRSSLGTKLRLSLRTKLEVAPEAEDVAPSDDESEA